jgi:hypothetical protein
MANLSWQNFIDTGIPIKVPPGWNQETFVYDDTKEILRFTCGGIVLDFELSLVPHTLIFKLKPAKLVQNGKKVLINGRETHSPIKFSITIALEVTDQEYRLYLDR